MSQVMLEDYDGQLVGLVEQALAGEEVFILRDGKAIAKIVALPGGKGEQRKPGFGSGKYALIYMADDFDAPLEDFEDYK